MSDQKSMAATLSDLDRAAGFDATAAGTEVFSAGDMPAAVAPQNQQQLAGMLSGVVMVSFMLVANKRGAHWAMDESSANEAGAAYAAVIVKYFPDFAGGPELTAIAITAALVGPRIIQDKLIDAQRQQQAQQDGESGD